MGKKKSNKRDDGSINGGNKIFQSKLTKMKTKKTKNKYPFKMLSFNKIENNSMKFCYRYKIN